MESLLSPDFSLIRFCLVYEKASTEYLGQMLVSKRRLEGTQMSKTEIIAKIAAEADVAKTVVRQVLLGMEKVAYKELKKADGVFTIPNIVKIQTVKTPRRAERKGRNPATGDTITIAAKPAGKKLRAKFFKAVKVEVGQLPKAKKKDD
jgi:DNA-binding protein HU-beta